MSISLALETKTFLHTLYLKENIQVQKTEILPTKFTNVKSSNKKLSSINQFYSNTQNGHRFI